ncbi:MAG: hypothetical protein RLO21_01740 [Nitratireductor sp.]
MRSKAGEATALRELDPNSKDRIFPIIHLSSNPPNTFADALSKAWNGRPLALDGLFNLAASGATTMFTNIFNDIGTAGVEVIPSIEPSAPPQYVQRVTQTVNRYGPGLVVKVTLAQLQNAAAWIAIHGWQPQEVDLVVNVGNVSDFDPLNFSGYVAATLNGLVGHPNDWRSVTLAAAAAPKDAGQLQRGRNSIPRKDWILWNHVQQQVQFDLDYGDYGAIHPDMTEPPGYAMARATVSARYTTDVSPANSSRFG